MKDNHLTTLQQEVLAYLTEQMGEQERATFQSRLVFDSALREELKLMRTAQKMGAILSPPPAAPSYNHLYQYVAAAVIGLMLTAAILYNLPFTPDTPSKPAQQTTPAIQHKLTAPTNEPVAAVQPNVKARPSVRKPATMKPRTVEASVASITAPPASITPDMTSDAAVAYNEEDFTDNVYLDEWQTGVRAQASVTLSQPPTQKLNLKRGKDGKIMLAFAGKTKLTKELCLEIYSNKQADFEAERATIHAEIPIQSDGSFEWSKTISLRPGLYYYLILGHNSDSAEVIGKIEIR